MVHFDNNGTNNHHQGEYDEESIRVTNIKNSLSHINQLIDMAEESKVKIVDLHKQMNKLSERLIYLILIIFSGMGFYAVLSKENYNSFSNYSLYTLILLVIVISVLTFALYTFLKQRSYIRIQISIERYILKDILGIVFDIRKMLDLSIPTGSLWIEFKVVDMKLKRLDFY